MTSHLRRPASWTVGGLVVAVLAFAAALAWPSASSGTPVPVLVEFPLGGSTDDLVAGPDGNLWFTEYDLERIGRITPSGAVTEFSAGLTAGGRPMGVAAGPDGNLWFTENAGDRIGRITPEGVITEFSAGITPGSAPLGITAGPDGNLWFTENAGSRIGRITTSGVVTEFSEGISTHASPRAITTGPDGNLWFTQPGTYPPDSVQGNRIGRITPEGVVTNFSAGITPYSGPRSIAAGSDGNLWFTEQFGSRVGRITPDGTVTEFSSGITQGHELGDIAAGPDGSLWFTGTDAVLGRITTSGTVAEFLPGVTGDSGPGAVARGPDGNMWLTRTGNPTLIPPLPSRIARLTFEEPPAPPTVPVVTGPFPGATKQVTARGSIALRAVRGGYRIRSLRLRGLTPRSQISVRCRSGCQVNATLKPRSITSANLTRLFARALIGRRALIVVRLTRPGFLGRELRWTVRNGRTTLRMRTVATTSARATY
jgi:virginiamycin B lyase